MARRLAASSSVSRRALLATIGASALLAASPPALAARVPLVGVLVTNIRRNATFPELSAALRQMGYVEGRNVQFRVASADGDSSRLPELAMGLVAGGVDVLFASGPAAIRAARAATSTIPIVALDLETDPVAAGWAASLARPGGNVTGLFLDLPAFVGKWMEILKEIDPRLRRVMLVWDAAAGPSQLDGGRLAAQRLGLDALPRRIGDVDDIKAAFAEASRSGIRGAVLLSSPTISQESPAIAVHAKAYRMLAISSFRLFPESGGLVSYGPRFDDFRRRGALFVARILKGAKAADLPIEQPTKFELVVNMSTARDLGIVLPSAILARADEVVP